MFSKLLRPTARAAVRFASSNSQRVAAAPVSRVRVSRMALAGLFAGASALALNAAIVEADQSFEESAKQHFEAAKEALKADAKLAAQAPKQVLWNAIRRDIEAIIDDENSSNPGVDGFPGNSGGGGDVGPMLIRLAWHCAGTYDVATGTGGSNGATMRFSPEKDHGANAGLGHARALLEPIRAKYAKAGVTYADLYVFSGYVALEAMGGPNLPFRPGRVDSVEGSGDKTFSPDGRLPDADGRDTDPANHLRDIFHRMGFNDRDIVALSGAHGLGRCHTDRSGFWGPWTFAPTTFSNEYFVVLEEKDWFIKRKHKGGDWKGPLQYEDETGELMMLPTDLVLMNDRVFRPIVNEYYKSEDKFFSDFSAAFVKLMELGCDDVLEDVTIVNLENLAEETAKKATQAVENFQASLGEIPKAAKKKKGWFW